MQLAASHTATPPANEKKKKNQIFFQQQQGNAHEQKMASGEKCAQNIKFKLP
jgi:hypothetical protein